MEFFQEICLTIISSVIFAFILSRLLSKASARDSGEQDSMSGLEKKFDGGVVAEKRVRRDEVMNLRLKPEERTEFVGEALKADEFQADLAQEKLERLQGSGERVEFREGDQMETKVKGLERLKAHECLQERAEINLVEEMHEVGEMSKIDTELGKNDQIPASTRDIGYETHQQKGIEGTQGTEKSRVNDEKGDDDDWEGIERSDLEKLFAAAVSFVRSTDNRDRLSTVDSNVQKQLYGLHKIATEGSCHEPQPMALKVSSRAKWNAWQRLGNMNPEVAMEQYVSLLSDSVPGWMGESPSVDSKKDSMESVISRAQDPDITTLPHRQLSLETERKQDWKEPSVEGGDPIQDPNYLDRDKLW